MTLRPITYWNGFYLHGTKNNHDAIGTFVRVEACGKFQVDSVRNGGSYFVPR